MEGEYTATISGLTNGAAYQVWVRAVNEAEAGTSSWAKATDNVPLAAPGEPTDVAVEVGRRDPHGHVGGPNSRTVAGSTSYDVRYCTPHGLYGQRPGLF